MNFAHFDPYEFVILSGVFGLVVAYWVFYTRSLKTPRNVGKNEGIAVAIERKQHPRKTARNA